MKNIIVVLLLSGCLLCASDKASALSSVYVNNTYTSTSTEGRVLGVDVFRTIQEAVNAVDENGTVYVSTGLYNESVTINKSLSLVGSRPFVKIGAHPNAPVLNGGEATGAILIDGTTEPVNVSVRNMIITKGKYSIAVLHNAKVTISNNTISHYAKNGITLGPVFLPEAGGISGVLSNNEIIGLGQTDTLAQNGIQVSENNTAIITGNKISNNIYTVPGKKWATGILIHQSGSVVIANNTLISNQIGINLIQVNASNVNGNNITGDQFTKAGIMVNNYDISSTNNTTGNTIKRNTLTGGLIGIWSSYAHGNKYISNSITSSLRNGIYLWNSSNNTLSGNTISSIRSSQYDNTSGIELDEEETSSSNDATTSGSHYNNLINNVIVKSDSGFLLAKNSKNNNFSNNRFNGILVFPADIQKHTK